jgi:hypothetical protein
MLYPYGTLKMEAIFSETSVMTTATRYKFPDDNHKRLGMFENRVLRRIFRPKRGDVKGGLRKLHNEEPHDLYSSSCIIRMIKSRRDGRACSTNCERKTVTCWKSGRKQTTRKIKT